MQQLQRSKRKSLPVVDAQGNLVHTFLLQIPPFESQHAEEPNVRRSLDVLSVLIYMLAGRIGAFGR